MTAESSCPLFLLLNSGSPILNDGLDLSLLTGVDVVILLESWSPLVLFIDGRSTESTLSLFKSLSSLEDLLDLLSLLLLSLFADTLRDSFLSLEVLSGALLLSDTESEASMMADSVDDACFLETTSSTDLLSSLEGVSLFALALSSWAVTSALLIACTQLSRIPLVIAARMMIPSAVWEDKRIQSKVESKLKNNISRKIDLGENKAHGDRCKGGNCT